jgi:hypothetical protein
MADIITYAMAAGMGMVDPLEQIVQSQGHEDKKDLGDELARDTEAKQPLGGRDAVGRRRRVSVHDQLAGNVQEAEDAHD